MKFKLIATLAAGCLSHAVAADIQAEIEAVEAGLRSSVQFKNDPNWHITERMQHYGVPGVSVAVIKDFKIHWVKHYGVTDKSTGTVVDDDTLFQAGSISKPVASYGALKLVEQKKLSLDSPVNEQLQGWKIPDNELTKKRPVALKHLMNHSAGLTVHGFGGYPPGAPVPTVKQILDGEKPANSAAVRVDLEPETQFRYSGGGYTVMQKLVADVSQKDYPGIMNELVLQPLKMSRSTYEQPLPPAKLKHAAAGYLPNKLPVPGKRHTYPEMAAAGLWTTAEDLAKFVIDVQLAIKSGGSQILSQATVNKMLTPFVSERVGLGFFIDSKSADEIYFGHGGWDEGFSADLVAHKTRGYGVVIMTNSNHPAFINELKNSVAAHYQWPQYLATPLQAMPISKAEQQRVVGRYRFTPDMIFNIFSEEERLFMQYLNGEKMEVFKIGDNQFIRREYDSKFRFQVTEKAGPVNLVFGVNNEMEEIRQRLKDDELVPLEWVIKGDFKQAEAAYRELFKAHPEQMADSEWNLLTRANVLNEQDQAKAALQVLEFSNRFYPFSANTTLRLAQQQQKLGDVEAAKASFGKLLLLDPGNQQALEAMQQLGGD